MTEMMNGVKWEISDCELAEVIGGKFYPETYYYTKAEVPQHFRVGNEVEVRFFNAWTYRCVVKAFKIGVMTGGVEPMYYERYEVEPINDTWYYPGGTYDIWDIEVRELPN